jgi:heme exporter protein B
VSALRGFLTVVRWDLALELRRREAVLNMTLFAALVLFISAYGLSGKPDLQAEFGPLVLWISILFAGTVGLSRAFAVEREAGVLTGVLLSPIDPGVYYLAKAAATWIHVAVMEVLLLGAYMVLFDYGAWDRLPVLLAVLGLFTLAYVAAGTVIAAMTTALRGGEVVLRVLLFPVMVPAVVIALRMGRWLFPDPSLPPPEFPARALAWLAFIAATYLAAGFLLFPKVIEE